MMVGGLKEELMNAKPQRRQGKERQDKSVFFLFLAFELGILALWRSIQSLTF
jgi:hypothetical protein